MSSQLNTFLEHAKHLRTQKNEQVLILFLHKKKGIIKKEVVATGTARETHLSAYRIFAPALLCGCHTFVIIHNHPSGKVFPSQNDYLTTLTIAEGAQLLQIKLYDHLIVTETDYFSFREAGIL